jgi:hypothetical protein
MVSTKRNHLRVNEIVPFAWKYLESDIVGEACGQVPGGEAATVR